MTSLLQVDALTVRYRGSDRPALDDVDLRVDAGETLALVGESGSGKSTLAQALIGLLPRSARIESGTIRLDDRVLSDAPERVWREVRGRRIALVPQDPTASLNPLLTIGTQVAESFLLHRARSREQAAADALSALARVGIDRPEARARQLPHQLSGGMQQRVLIAMALASEPDVLIADEPTSALDVTVQKTVLDTLADLTSTSATAVVLITHDLGVAVDRAQRIAVLHRGVVVESGAAAGVLSSPSAQYTRDLIRAAPSLTSERLVDETAPSPSEQPRVRVNDLARTFHLPGRSAVLAARGVGFMVGAGRTIAIVGESGSGKTTVARMIAGAEIEDEGSIDIDDLTVTAIPRDRLRAVGERVQLVHQHPGTAMDPRWTVAQVISEALVGIVPRAARAARVRELLDDVALDPALAGRTPNALSGGQRQRIAIARALAKDPRVLVLDEPVSALDVIVQAQVLALLARLQRERGLTYVFVSHDLAVVRQIAHEVIVMRAGEIVERGAIDGVFDAPSHEYTRALLDAIPGRAERSTPASVDLSTAEQSMP